MKLYRLARPATMHGTPTPYGPTMSLDQANHFAKELRLAGFNVCIINWNTYQGSEV